MRLHTQLHRRTSSSPTGAAGRFAAVRDAAWKSFCLAIVAVFLGGAFLAPLSAAEEETPDPTDDPAENTTVEEEPAIEEVDQLPVMYKDPAPVDPAKPIEVKDDAGNLGWLILNPKTRRGYQILEVDRPTHGIVIQSFDLDTLKPIRRALFSGLLTIHGGGTASSPGLAASGEVVHAVDEEKGRIFLAVAERANVTVTVGESSFWRLLSKVLVIDEAVFNDPTSTASDFATSLAIPPNQQALATHGAVGMTFVPGDGGGKLLMLLEAYAPVTVRGHFDHYLAQWDDAGGSDWLLPLEPCQRAVMRANKTGVYQVGILHGAKAIHVVCQESHGVATAVRIPLGADGNPPLTPAFETFPLPKRYHDVFADQGGQRLLVKTVNQGEVWYVFDAEKKSWAGAMTVLNGIQYASAGLDASSGRFYALIPDYATSRTGGGGVNELFPVQGGLVYGDTRLTPVPEASFATRDLAYPALFRIVVDPADPATGRPRRVFVRRGNRQAADRYVYPSTVLNDKAPVEPFYRVLEDRADVAEQPNASELDSRTIDVEEDDEITTANYDASSSGYGTRVVLTGGLAAATRYETDVAQSECSRDDRELALGSVESASLSNLTAAARATALTSDQTTREDLAQPSGRCWPAAFGPSPIPKDEPEEDDEHADPEEEIDCSAVGNDLDKGLASVEHPWDNDADCQDDFTSACSGDSSASAAPDRPFRTFRSSSECALAKEQVAAAANGSLDPVRDVGIAPVSVAYSHSEIATRRVPGEGVVTEVRSISRGIVIEGVGAIGAIVTEATVRAGGRPKTAKTTFVRTMCGIDLPTAKVAGCLVSDERGRSDQQESIVDGFNRAFGRYMRLRLREPDRTLAKGTPGGYLAAIQRSPEESFADEKIARDSSTAVPGLELVFYRDDPVEGAGRQIYQFAGVKASTAYGIACLYGPAEPLETDTDTDTDGLDTDADTDTDALDTNADTETDGPSTEGGDGGCALPPSPDPSRLTIVLNDDTSAPLEGGVFEIHVDSDTDGVLGPDDEVIDNGSCVTGDDGTGDCVFDDLAPGAYVIEQTSAPPGYAKAPAFAHVVDPATEYTVTFTNLKSVAGVQISLTDDSAEAKPLAGGVFEVFADDGDELLGEADVLYAACTTDDTGTCELDVKLAAPSAGDGDSVIGVVDDLVDAVCEPLEGATGCVLDVPLGSYVVHQSAAPDGFATAGDVGFTFDQPGQVATLAFVNGLAGSGAVVEATPGTPDIPPTPPTEVLVWDEGSGTPQPIVESSPLAPPKRSLSDRASDALTQVLSVPLEAFRFLFNNPREVGLMAAVWALLFLPCYLGERRRVLDRLRTHIATSEAA